MTRNPRHINRTLALGAASLAALLLTAPSAFAFRTMRVNIPFEFVAGAKTMPAGDYDFEMDQNGETLMIRGPEGSSKHPSSTAKSVVLTTVAAGAHTNSDHTDLIFDKVGDTATLSEIRVPGEDGLLLVATKGNHEHQIVHVKNK